MDKYLLEIVLPILSIVMMLLFSVGTLVFLAYGYILNLITIFGMENLNGQMLLRIASLFLPPLGGILGYF